MKLAIVSALAATLWAHAAHADQCQWLADPSIATRATHELASHPDILSFCEPCGDPAPEAPRRASVVKLRHVDDRAVAVEIDGSEVDLAYTYVKTSDHQYRNLAALAGCATAGVSPSLRVDAATTTGVLIRSDHRGPLALPVVQALPAAPPTEAAAPTIYIESSSPDLAVLLLGTGALFGFLVAGATWVVTRRRPRHVPRAADLEPRG